MCKEVREVSAKEGPDGEEHNSSKATTLAHKTLIFFILLSKHIGGQMLSHLNETGTATVHQRVNINHNSRHSVKALQDLARITKSAKGGYYSMLGETHSY